MHKCVLRKSNVLYSHWWGCSQFWERVSYIMSHGSARQLDQKLQRKGSRVCCTRDRCPFLYNSFVEPVHPGSWRLCWSVRTLTVRQQHTWLSVAIDAASSGPSDRNLRKKKKKKKKEEGKKTLKTQIISTNGVDNCCYLLPQTKYSVNQETNEQSTPMETRGTAKSISFCNEFSYLV